MNGCRVFIGFLLAVLTLSQSLAQGEKKRPAGRVPRPEASRTQKKTVLDKVPVQFVLPLKVERNLLRHSNWYEVNLQLTNRHATDRLGYFIVTDDNVGFQSADRAWYVLPNQSPKAASCELSNEVTVSPPYNRVKIELPNTLVLSPGETITVRYHVVPVLYPTAVPNVVGQKLKISYRQGFRSAPQGWPQHCSSFPSTRTDLTGSIAQALQSAGYLLVTDPLMVVLNNLGSQEDVWKLFGSMARLAEQRTGVLGFFDRVSTLPQDYAAWIFAMGARLSPGWQIGGHLLLVGEDEIIPSWRINHHVEFAHETVDWIPQSDHTYSDVDYDGFPELRVGRMLGETAAELRDGIQHSLEGREFWEERVRNIWHCSGLFISGYVNGDENFKEHTRNGGNWVKNLLGVWMDFAHYVDQSPEHQNWTDMQDFLTVLVPNKDLIVYDGHGATSAWSGFLGESFVSSLGIHGTQSRPQVIGFACLSGNYQTASIARSFLKGGAATYMGATQSLAVSTMNRLMDHVFWDYWKVDKAIGNAHFQQKAHELNFHPDDPYSQLFVYAFNLYGDPTYRGGR